MPRIKVGSDRSLILLVTPLELGESAFCHRVVLNSVAADRPLTFVTTERSAIVSDCHGPQRTRLA